MNTTLKLCAVIFCIATVTSLPGALKESRHETSERVGKVQNFVLLFLEPDEEETRGGEHGKICDMDFPVQKMITPYTDKFEKNIPHAIKDHIHKPRLNVCSQILKTCLMSLLAWAENVRGMSTASVILQINESKCSSESPNQETSTADVETEPDTSTCKPSESNPHRPADGEKKHRKTHSHKFYPIRIHQHKKRRVGEGVYFPLVRKRRAYSLRSLRKRRHLPVIKNKKAETRRSVLVPNTSSIIKQSKNQADSKALKRSISPVEELKSKNRNKRSHELDTYQNTKRSYDYQPKTDDIIVLPLKIKDYPLQSDLPRFKLDEKSSSDNTPVYELFPSRRNLVFNDISPYSKKDAHPDHQTSTEMDEIESDDDAEEQGDNVSEKSFGVVLKIPGTGMISQHKSFRSFNSSSCGKEGKGGGDPNAETTHTCGDHKEPVGGKGEETTEAKVTVEGGKSPAGEHKSCAGKDGGEDMSGNKEEEGNHHLSEHKNTSELPETASNKETPDKSHKPAGLSHDIAGDKDEQKPYGHKEVPEIIAGDKEHVPADKEHAVSEGKDLPDSKKTEGEDNKKAENKEDDHNKKPENKEDGHNQKPANKEDDHNQKTENQEGAENKSNHGEGGTCHKPEPSGEGITLISNTTKDDDFGNHKEKPSNKEEDNGNHTENSIENKSNTKVEDADKHKEDNLNNKCNNNNNNNKSEDITNHKEDNKPNNTGEAIGNHKDNSPNKCSSNEEDFTDNKENSFTNKPNNNEEDISNHKEDHKANNEDEVGNHKEDSIDHKPNNDEEIGNQPNNTQEDLGHKGADEDEPMTHGEDQHKPSSEKGDGGGGNKDVDNEQMVVMETGGVTETGAGGHEQKANMDVFEILNLMATIKNSFFSSMFGPGFVNDQAKFRNPSMFEMATKLIDQLTTMDNKKGYIAVIMGGKFSDLKNSSSDLVKLFDYLSHKCDRNNTTIVVSGSCPQGDQPKSIPLLATGASCKPFESVQELYDIPQVVKSILKSCDDDKSPELNETPPQATQNPVIHERRLAIPSTISKRQEDRKQHASSGNTMPRTMSVYLN